MAKKYLKYLISGKVVPSVTTILNELSKPGLEKWYGRLGIVEAEKQKNDAADFGSKIHAIIEAVYQGQTPSYSDDRLKSAAENFQKWADHNIEEWVAFERAVYHDELMYAGTVDAFARLKGSKRLVLVDFKGLALDTPIPTPNGWTTMGELGVGDEVFGRDGNICKVMNKSEIHQRKSYKISFDDSSTIIADDEHLWPVTSPNKRFKGIEKILSTQDLYNSLKEKSYKTLNCILNTAPLILKENSLPIEPYLFGCWLGDGCKNDGKITGIDEEIFERIETLGYKISNAHGTNLEKAPTKCIYGLRTKLKKNNLFGKTNIPIAYTRSSIQQRIDLLRGLMDTDGTYNKTRHQVVFDNTQKEISNLVFELAASLGERPYLCPSKVSGFGVETISYRVHWTPINFNPFYLSRKANKVVVDKHQSFFRRIKDIEEIPSVASQCITVDSKDSCYLAGRQMIPTHNTSKKIRDEYYLQVVAYAKATRIEDDVVDLSEVQGAIIVHLDHETLTWEAVNADLTEDLFNVFKSCLNIHKWRTKTG